jgi:hypothetical protein
LLDDKYSDQLGLMRISNILTTLEEGSNFFPADKEMAKGRQAIILLATNISPGKPHVGQGIAALFFAHG